MSQVLFSPQTGGLLRAHICAECGHEFLHVGRPSKFSRFCSRTCSNRARCLGKIGSQGQTKPHLLPIKHPSVSDIAWAAGIYEGEGSISKRTAKGGGVISVPQKDRWILDKLRNLFGGTVCKRKTRDIHEWYVCGGLARGFTYSIFTFLSPRRRKQIKGILTIQRGGNGHGSLS